MTMKRANDEGTGASKHGWGALLALGLAAAPAAADTVIAPNAIVPGRACVGTPCQSGDTLGSTLVLRTLDAGGGVSVGPSFEITKETNTGTALQRWKIFSSSTDALIFRADTDGTNPFSLSDSAPTDSLTVLPSGNVNVGSATNSASLHVRRTNGTAKVKVEEASVTTQSRNLLQIVNNGAATFRFDNTVDASSWGFGSRGNGDFFIGKTPGQPLAFNLSGLGDVTITGTLQQGSDRAAKQDIESLEPARVLAQVTRLEIASWRYKGDSSTHVGPMAQDFHAAFGLGADDKHIAPGDMAGVGLAAIQALARENESLRSELARLLERVAALEAQR
jgi:hypothetical protein